MSTPASGPVFEPYIQLDYAMAEKDAVMIIQHVRYWATKQEVPLAQVHTIYDALTRLDDQNIIVDGSSAGAEALAWAALGPDRSMSHPFVDLQDQYLVNSRPKAAILQNGQLWWPIFSECGITTGSPHFGCDLHDHACPGDTLPSGCDPYSGFGSSVFAGAETLRIADAEELYKSSALWYSQLPVPVADIPVYMRYEQDFECTDYSPTFNGSTFSYSCEGQETLIHPSWNGYAWKYLHPDTRLIISGCEAFAKQDDDAPIVIPGVIGVLVQDIGQMSTADEDNLTTDQIVWLHKIVGSPATDQQPWIPLEYGVLHDSSGFHDGCVKVSVKGTADLTPKLTGSGTLEPNTSYTITLTQAKPGAHGLCFHGTQEAFTAYKGGLMVPVSDGSPSGVFTSPAGTWSETKTWPAGMAGVTMFHQAWVVDSVAVQGQAGSNGLMSVGQ